MKLSICLAIVGWISTFALAWLIILEIVPIAPVTWFFFVFFLVVAFFASISTVTKPNVHNG